MIKKDPKILVSSICNILIYCSRNIRSQEFDQIKKTRIQDSTLGPGENPEEGQVDTMAWNVDALELFSNLL